MTMTGVDDHAFGSNVQFLLKPAANLAQVVVADRPQEGEHDGGAGGADQEKQWGAHVASSYRPNNPAGRNANVSSSTPNATAGDQDGP